MKATVVAEVDWFDIIVALDICELVMFPLIRRSTIAPLFVVDGTILTDGDGEENGVACGVGVTLEIWDGDCVEAGVEVKDGFGVSDAGGVAVGLGLSVGSEVDVGVGLGEDDWEGVGVNEGIGV